jgi:DinB superfamily
MTMQPVLHSFAYCLDYLRDQVVDLSPDQMVTQPSGIMNHPAWVIGHLTGSCQLLGGEIGLSPWLPDDWAAQFGTGSVPTSHARMYEPKEAALARLADAQSRITAAVSRLDDSQLDQQLPDEAHRAVLPTIRHALTHILVGHTANHVGQLILWRKAMRLPPLNRPFE